MHPFQLGSIPSCILLPVRRPVEPARVCRASSSGPARPRCISTVLAVVCLLFLVSLDAGAIVPGLGSEFAYQGRLSEGGAPATGRYDLRFRLFLVPSGGIPVGFTQTFNAHSVSNGL